MPPSGNVGDLTGGGIPPQGARPGAPDPRQQQSELAQRLQDAQELRRLLDRNSPSTQDLDRVIQEIQKMRADHVYNDPAGIALLQQTIDRLHQVELALTRDLAAVLQSDKYFYADDSEAPASYKKLVEEYYKSLAKIKR